MIVQTDAAAGGFDMKKKWTLADKLYKALKWILATAVAPTVALITGLGELYHFETGVIVGTITLIATFLGALIGYSNHNYKVNQTVNELDSEITE
jgi:hypothetical protein